MPFVEPDASAPLSRMPEGSLHVRHVASPTEWFVEVALPWVIVLAVTVCCGIVLYRKRAAIFDAGITGAACVLVACRAASKHLADVASQIRDRAANHR